MPKRRKAGFIGKRESKRLNAAYRAARLAYREANPDRTHAIETATYVAPPELRPKLPEDRE